MIQLSNPSKRQEGKGKSSSASNIKDKENAEKINNAVNILVGIADNSMTPKHVRQSIKDIISNLKDEKLDYAIRAANAVSMLDELTQSPNVPSHMRVTLWQVVSILESVR